MKLSELSRPIFVLFSSLVIIYLNRSFRTRGFDSFIYREAVFYLLIPLAIIAVMRINPSEMGLSFGKRSKVKRYFIMLFLAALPFMLIGSRMDAFRLYYPRFNYDTWLKFVYWELMVGILMLSTEFMYRGYMLFGLKRLGRVAILIQAIPYMLIHIGKPDMEVYYSFFAGIAFGYVDWESDTVMTSFLLHWTTSILFDIMCTL